MPGPLRIRVEVTAGPAAGRTFEFDEPDTFLFGRSADARISLPDDPYVSRHHFVLEISPPDCKVTDLGSKNGTFVNRVRFGGTVAPRPGVKLAPAGASETRINSGDQIVVGDTQMRVEIQLVAAPAPPPAEPQPDAVTEPTPRDDPNTLRHSGESHPRPVSCAQCGSDVTVEVGLRGQVDGAEYVCFTCRAAVKAEPVKRLRALREKPDRRSSSGDHGLSLDDYDLLEQVGEGGMARVFRALDKRTGRIVAVKAMLPDVASTPAGVRSFMREMDITRQIRHPNVVDLLGFVKARGTYFLVMEFVEGNDLATLVRTRGGKLKLKELAPLMLGVLDGLGHAHRAHITVRLASDQVSDVVGIVHRDLKPSNIFLAQDGERVTPKIADFGLAKAFRAAGLTDMTRPGEVSGTPGYWPREQLVHYRYLAPASDVFSAAAVFYEALTGARIRQGFAEMHDACRKASQPPGLAQYIQVICANPTVPIHQRDPEVPAAVAAVIDRALREGVVSGGPDQVREALGELRYVDATAFADALRTALTEAGF